MALALLIRIADALALGGLIAIALRETPEILKHRLIPTLTVIFALCFAAAWASRRPALTSTVGYSFIDLALAGVMILVIMASTYSRFLSSLQ